MRTSTLPFASVRASAQAAAKEFVRLLMHPRDVTLKRRAPRDPHTHRQRRKISCDEAKPAEMILLQSLTDLADGASFAEVAEPYRYALALLEAAASAGGTAIGTGALLPAMVRETRAQGALDEAQARLLVHPNDPAALEAVLRASAAYDAAQEAMVDTVRRRRLAVTSIADRAEARAYA